MVEQTVTYILSRRFFFFSPIHFYFLSQNPPNAPLYESIHVSSECERVLSACE